MARTFMAFAAQLGIVMTLAIGPGLSLSRCLLTGRVSVTCCCAGSAADTPAGLGDPAESCCDFQRLQRPWTSAEISRHLLPAVVATSAVAPCPADLRPLALPSGSFLEPAVAESPPLWLSAPRV